MNSEQFPTQPVIDPAAHRQSLRSRQRRVKQSIKLSAKIKIIHLSESRLWRDEGICRAECWIVFHWQTDRLPSAPHSEVACKDANFSCPCEETSRGKRENDEAIRSAVCRVIFCWNYCSGILPCRACDITQLSISRNKKGAQTSARKVFRKITALKKQTYSETV